MQTAQPIGQVERAEACNLCGERVQIPFRVVEGRPIVRCGSCGLLYVRDRVSDAALNAIYAESYYRDRGMMQDDLDLQKESRRERLEWLPPPPGRLLDVGCGVGAFLADARDAGWSVEGTELSEWSLATARKAFGMEVVHGSVEDMLGSRWAPGAFDVVTCWHNIEHQRNPRRAIEAMRDLLKPGGRLVLRTPNASSFDQWWYGEGWVGWHDPGHFYFFGLDQMARYCRTAGLRVVHVDRGTTRALEGPKALFRRLRGKPAGPGPRGGVPVPQPSGPAGKPGIKRSLLRLASYVASGRDMTILAEKPR